MSPTAFTDELGGQGEAIAPLPAGVLRPGQRRRAMRLVTLAWIWGAVWQVATQGMPLTLYARALNASEFQFGLLTAIPFLTSLLSLPSSWMIERTGRRKLIFLSGLYPNRLLWFPLALVPLWLVSRGEANRPVALMVFIGIFFLIHSGQGLGGISWVSWMADLVPERIRGRYFSRRRQWGVMLALPAAFAVGWVLDRFNIASDPLRTMTVAGAIFIVAGIFGTSDILTFQWIPGIPKPPRRGGGLLRAMREPLHDKQFLLLSSCVAMLQFAVGFMTQFTALYMVERMGCRNTGTQLMLLAAPAMAQLLVFPAWGVASDRFGNKAVLALAATGLVPIGFAWCFMTPGALWLGFLLSAMGAAFWSGIEVVNLNITLDKSGTDPEAQGMRGSSYVAVNTVLLNVGGCLGGLVSGILGQSLSHWSWTPFDGGKTITYFEVLFAVGGIVRLGAMFLLPLIKEQPRKPAGEALRFMLGNVYGEMWNLATIPARLTRKKNRRVARPTVGRATPPVGTNRAP